MKESVTILTKKCNALVINGLKTKNCNNEITNCEKFCCEHKEQHKFEKPDDCPICMETVNDKLELPLTCGHWIHKQCLKNTEKNTCPICRKKMTEQELKFIGIRIDDFENYFKKMRERQREIEVQMRVEHERTSQLETQNQSIFSRFVPSSISRWFGF